jgi:hypothetical protein
LLFGDRGTRSSCREPCRQCAETTPPPNSAARVRHDGMIPLRLAGAPPQIVGEENRLGDSRFDRPPLPASGAEMVR